MVEMEIYDAPVISADRTGAARLLYEDPLDLLVAAGDRFANAAFAPPTVAAGSLAVAVKHDPAVAPAQPHRSCALRRRWTTGLPEERRGRP
jgi:hypothetical protein